MASSKQTPKRFDSVAMKRRVQARIQARGERMGAAAADRARHTWLETSEDPLAVFWRGLATKGGAARSKPRRKTAG